MCRTFDEAWDVWETWTGTGTCVDCRHVGRVTFEALYIVSGDDVYDGPIALFLNDGVPDWSDGFEDNVFARVHGDYRGDITEHWDEAEVERTLPFGRLAAAARRAWRRPRSTERYDVATVARMVDASLARLRADTGLTFAPL